MLAVFLTAYGAVFVAEIAGDKLLYTTGILAARYRTLPIICGMGLAFALKMGLAVLAGKLVSTLPPLLVAALTAGSFLGVAYAVWRKSRPRPEPQPAQPSSAAVMSFLVILFSEWGDPGQLAAAAMAARYAAPVTVWMGAVAAMATKGILAASLGAGIRQWLQRQIPPTALRYCGVTLLLLLGFMSVLEVLRSGHA